MAGHTLTEARYLSATETAKIIRAALKKAFAGTKFSVRTDRTGSIRISRTDGPTTKEVEAIVGVFEGKGFDGSIDLQYHIDGWMLNGEIVGTRSRGTAGSRGTVEAWGMIAPHDDCELVSFGAGYIFCHRSISPALANQCIAQVGSYWGGVEQVPTAVEGYDGFKLVPESMGRQPVRSDLPSYPHDWYSSIRRCAEEPQEFSRDA